VNPPNQTEEDALRTIKELNTLSADIETINNEISLAENLLQKINDTEKVNVEDLQIFGLTQQSPTTLKLRLRGILSTKRSKLSELKKNYNNDLQLLQDLKKCPACQGKGTITKVSYTRDERIITPITKTEQCSNCTGTGEASLSSHVKTLINSFTRANLT